RGVRRSEKDLHGEWSRWRHARARCARGKVGEEVLSSDEGMEDSSRRMDAVFVVPSRDPARGLGTNTIEALNRILRKALKTRGPLPTIEAAQKLVYLAMKNASKTWGRGTVHWNIARLQFAIHFGDRFPLD